LSSNFYQIVRSIDLSTIQKVHGVFVYFIIICFHLTLKKLVINLSLQRDTLKKIARFQFFSKKTNYNDCGFFQRKKKLKKSNKKKEKRKKPKKSKKKQNKNFKNNQNKKKLTN
jgi:hypothetical protein